MRRFWEIAIPVMLVVVPLFLLNDFKRVAHYIEKRAKRRAITKVRLPVFLISHAPPPI